MKISRSKPSNQAVLPGMEQALCACGCGQYFMRISRGRKRLYLNDTHKKRVMRARRKEFQQDRFVHLTPKGRELVKKLGGKDYTAEWDKMTSDQQWAVHLMGQHPSGVKGFWNAILELTNPATRYLDDVLDELEAEYENG